MLLLGIVKIELVYYSFVVEDLVGEEQYVISMNISLCLEANGPCEVSLVLFDNDRLPKPKCDWNTDFIIPGDYQTHVLWLYVKVFLDYYSEQ